MLLLGRSVIVALSLVGLVAGSACSNDKKGERSEAPEDKRTSAAAVAVGLHQIDAIAKQIAAAAGTDQAKAKQLDAQIEPAWQRIEGTVKANDKDAYLTFEDSFALLHKAAKDNDGALGQQGSAAVSKAVADYLAKFPG